MKKLILGLMALLTASAFAQTPQFENLSKEDVEDVSREFSANFAHTGVSAPETDGLWGVEVGFLGGRTNSPELEDVVNASGGEGDDFANIYHAGLMARGHFPFDLFAEIVILPEQDISDVTVKNSSIEVGWNAGAFFGLPVDLAIAANVANSEISFEQDPTGTIPVESKITLESKTTMLWIGVSKTFLFVTPYFKLGRVKADSDLKATANIFDVAVTGNKQSVDSDGSYLALGANLQWGFFKFGAEVSRLMGVNRATGKISFDF